MITHSASPTTLAELDMEKLPALPQILVRLLKICQNDNADFHEISRVVSQDAAISGRILTLANSAFYSSADNVSTLERALLVLGTDALKSLIINAAVQQFFDSFDKKHTPFLKAFWRSSLCCALLSKSFASLTKYAIPEQAYLAGLLHNVGSLVLQSQFPERYQTMLDTEDNITEGRDIAAAEMREFGVNHCDLGAELLSRWGVDKLICDAVSYHHENTESVGDAHHLLKLVALAATLSDAQALTNPQSYSAAETLFGLIDPLTKEIVLQIHDEVEAVAKSMGVNIDSPLQNHDEGRIAMASLATQVKNIGLLQNVKDSLSQSRTQHEFNAQVVNTISVLFGVESALLFEVNDSCDALVYNKDPGQKAPSFKIGLQSSRSMIADAALECRPKSSFDHSTTDSPMMTVVDRQVLGLSSRAGILCVPIIHKNVCRGVIVLGLDKPFTIEKQQLICLLGAEVARAMVVEDARAQSDVAEHQNYKAGVESRLREIAHEANNPLSIIRNYLEVLALKMGDEHQAKNELRILREEIERTGKIILQLNDLNDVALENNERFNVNSELTDLVDIYQKSLFLTHKIQCEMHLDSGIPPILIGRNLIKQVLINLIKNAVEAMSGGGKIVLTSADRVNLSGREYVEIVVSDNGSGLPDAVRGKLFSPVESSKRHGSGLGLSISNRLVTELGGTITYRRAANMSEFRILLPRKI
jgi:HD-like signal output (HDOD) protein/signal transduction histidine kinase